jgi:hypothetical protein
MSCGYVEKPLSPGAGAVAARAKLFPSPVEKPGILWKFPAGAKSTGFSRRAAVEKDTNL